MDYLIYILIVIMALAAICFLPKGFIRIEPPERRAGRRAEKYATEIIESVLNIDDVLLSNVSVSFDSKPTELDSVVINKYGVFIIEVKYYSGRLEGTEDNFKWTKYHVSGGGNTYVKMVKNPIKQVKRQVYILANYLRDHSVNVWVNGFAMIIGADSPVSSDYIITNKFALDHRIHSATGKTLNKQEIERIKSLL